MGILQDEASNLQKYAIDSLSCPLNGQDAILMKYCSARVAPLPGASHWVSYEKPHTFRSVVDRDASIIVRMPVPGASARIVTCLKPRCNQAVTMTSGMREPTFCMGSHETSQQKQASILQ